MLLLNTHWTRVAGGIVAGLVILGLLRAFFPPHAIFHISSHNGSWTAGAHAVDQEHEDATTATMTAASGNQIAYESSRTYPARTSSANGSPPTSITTTALGSEKPSQVPGLPSQEPITSVTTTTGKTSTITAGSEPTELRKTIVMGKLSSEDTDWVQHDMQDWDHAVYYVDLAGNQHSPSGLRTKINKAKEATPYLTYIVEHYDGLPDVAVFLHAHRNSWPAAWHNDAKGHDAVNMLHELKLDVVLERGYVNLRCIGEPGCPNEVQLNRNPPEEDRRAELAYPYVYGQFFNLTVEKVKEQMPVVATPCCAQFAVSKAQIQQKPKAEYARYLTLIEESDYDDETLGTVMEYMWHLIFGRDAVHCENTAECWANIYGRQDGWSSWT